MPHPWVYSATITDGKITLSVEVTDLQTTKEAIEIKGEATQVNGAFAPISCITNIAAATMGDPTDPNEAGRLFVNVEADPTSDHPFDENEDLTVTTEVGIKWLTVLGPGTDEPTPATTHPGSTTGPTWGKRKADAHISSTSSY